MAGLALGIFVVAAASGVIVMVCAGSSTPPVPFFGNVTCPLATICGTSVGAEVDDTGPSPLKAIDVADAFLVAALAVTLKSSTPVSWLLTAAGSVMAASLASGTSCAMFTGQDVCTSTSNFTPVAAGMVGLAVFSYFEKSQV